MNRVTKLFGVKYPIIQAGMIWCSGWELAAAVSNSGGLGIIGSGSMYPEVLDEHIQKCKATTDQPFAVNLPMLYPAIDEHIQTIIQNRTGRGKCRCQQHGGPHQNDRAGNSRHEGRSQQKRRSYGTGQGTCDTF